MREFVSAESGSAGLLLAALLIALAWANSPLSDGYTSLWSTEVSVRAGDAELAMSLRHWATDGLMFLFFLVIGMEVPASS
jgi:Na+/H+ antiporter NhaA